MKRTRLLHPLLGAVLGGLLLAPAAPGLGEVTKTREAMPPIQQKQIPPAPVHGDTPLRVQCWQEGVKIIDQDGLKGLSLNSVTQQRSVSFKRLSEAQPSVFILPFDKSICLVQPVR